MKTTIRSGDMKLSMRNCFGGLRTARKACVLLHAGPSFTTDRFLDEVAFVQPPKYLSNFLRVIEAQGMELAPPTERKNIHPFVIPVAHRGSELVGLLRWPNPNEYPQMELPVVSTSVGGPSVTFLARSVEEYVKRALVAEEIERGEGVAGPVAEAVGAEAAALYTTGDFNKSGLKRIEAYLTRRVGPFPDVMEALAKGHLAKGDQNGLTSALVTGEFYMKNNLFPGIARPYEFNAELLASVSRPEEARDVARIALRLPWWTLTAGVEATKKVALLQGDAKSIRYQLSEEAMAQSAAARQSRVPSEPKGPSQVALDQASLLMNQAAAGETTWEAVRPQLATLYRAAGAARVADLIEKH